MDNAPNADDPTVNGIHDAIRMAYVSLSRPEWFFVERTAAEQPYREFLDHLERRFDITDTTDFNDDVSLDLVLCGNEHAWSLMLSLVGRYAVLWRLRPSRAPTPITEKDSLTGTETWVMELLRAHHIKLLEKRVLETPVALRLHNTLPGRSRVFQALFSDMDILPWEDR